MTSLALQAGVSALGFGPAVSAVLNIGASVLGSQIDNAIFGNDDSVRSIGQRIEELRIQSSAYGKMIPIPFGSSRFAGNIIWSLDIIEEEITSTTGGGGKGGPTSPPSGGQSSTTVFNYYATLAIGICEGPITEIVKIWADSKVLTPTLSTITSYSEYLGSEDQEVDPLIESYVGVGQTPAYRGLAYVVFEKLPLSAFGNRIPNFTFEVRKQNSLPESVENVIESLVIIPGAGEFVYDTQTKYEKFLYNAEFVSSTVPIAGPLPVNVHNANDTPDINISLNQMFTGNTPETGIFPNLKRVSVVVGWFASSRHAYWCNITPRVEFNSKVAVYPEGSDFAPDAFDWEVAGFHRGNAQAVTHINGIGEVDNEGAILTYGGTPSDRSVIQLLRTLKERGLEVMFYPFLFVDTLDAPTFDYFVYDSYNFRNPDGSYNGTFYPTDGDELNKPWRGRITAESASEVNDFFERLHGYNEFIEHYANLSVSIDGDSYALKDYVDYFVIGSEMIGLTSQAFSGTYTAVNKFRSLASTVKTAVGSSVKVGYAADWSEYHTTDGVYNMDPLFSDSNIDFVGIDYYMPLTPDLNQAVITKELIKEYFEKGEGWEYFYTDAVARTGKTDYTPNDGTSPYAWKNIYNWWNSTHYNPGDVATDWTPKMKEIMLTEYGFPSVDGCSNQPNVFVDPTSSESFYPRKSNRRIDFYAQRQGIEALEEYFAEKNSLPGNSNFMGKRFLWTWDARPYSLFPSLESVWADTDLWKTGHWVTGKLGQSNLAAIVSDLLVRIGLEESEFDVTELVDVVEGFVILRKQPLKTSLSQLQAAYMFDCVESNGKLIFKKKINGVSVETIEKDSLVPVSPSEVISLTRTEETALPRQVDVNYINRFGNYDIGSQTAQRQSSRALDTITIELAVVLPTQIAASIALILLYNFWSQRNKLQFILPAKYCRLEPTDIVTINADDATHVVKILNTRLDRNGLLVCRAVSEDTTIYNSYSSGSDTPVLEKEQPVLTFTSFELLDLPALPADVKSNPVMRVAMTSGEYWNGATLYRSDDNGDSYVFMLQNSSKAVIGAALTDFPDGSTYVFDELSTLSVALRSGSLSSVSELQLLNGYNTAVLYNPTVGEFEVIQFQNAELVSENEYLLSRFLRGRLGTEHVTSGHLKNSVFVYLNDSVKKIEVPIAFKDVPKQYKCPTIGKLLSSAITKEYTYKARTLRPYSVASVTGEIVSSDWIFTWIRRTRLAGDWNDGQDVPLSEESERYEVDIMDGSDVVRTIETVTQTTTYTLAQQTADFGSHQTSITIRIYQISAIFGRGVVKEESF